MATPRSYFAWLALFALTCASAYFMANDLDDVSSMQQAKKIAASVLEQSRRSLQEVAVPAAGGDTTDTTTTTAAADDDDDDSSAGDLPIAYTSTKAPIIPKGGCDEPEWWPETVIILFLGSSAILLGHTGWKTYWNMRQQRSGGAYQEIPSNIVV